MRLTGRCFTTVCNISKDAEEHIWQKKTGKLPAHDKAPRPTLDINVTARKGDRRRLEQPKIEDLPDEHRQYLAKSKEQFLSETYVNPLVAIETPLEKKKLFIKRVRVPPPVPGAPAVKRKVGANGEPITIADDANEDGNGDNHNDEDEGEENGQHTQHTQSTGAHTQSSLGTAGSSQISIQAGLSSKEHLRNAFYGPPLALSDVERAADPAERNYMTSEDFAILMWYTRTIPYCGAEETLDGSPKFRHDYHQYRWNWARTHGVCLRPITSMQERWRRVVLFVFNGKQPIPEGTFRNFLAQSGFFYFEGDRILTYNVAAIKDANARCLTLLDADPTKDPYTQIEDKDKELYQEAIERISIKHVHVHEGQRWIAEAAAAAEPAEEAEED